MALLTGTDQNYYEGSDYGNYQLVSIRDIINQFMIAYVGEEKIISKARRVDVAFHAQRALAELSFDTLKSIKSQEIELPPSLTMILPRDYVNYTRLSWSDSSGIKHPLYPTRHTSNPFKVKQDTDGNYDFQALTGDIGENLDFESALVMPWAFNSAVDNSTLSGNVSTSSSQSDIVNTIGGKLQISTNPFTMINNANPSGVLTGRAYACWQEINVSNINELSITATGTSAAAESGKSEGGILRVGISITPGWADTNLQKNVPSLNDQIVTGNTQSGPNFLPGTSSSTTNANINNEVLEWNATAGETDIIKSLNNIDVSGYNKVYILITSYTPFLSDDAAISTNTVDDISVTFEGVSPSLVRDGDSTTWSNYKSQDSSELIQQDYRESLDLPFHRERYGLQPSHAQTNGSFYIDEFKGLVHFSSNISGKTVILDYISDSLGTADEMQVHKFAEDAMYKYIMHAVLSTRANVPEYVVRRYQKEKFAATRKAKLRLSNIKLEELTQILRDKSKWIKH